MFSIKRTTSIDSHFLELIKELDQDLWNRYGEQQGMFTPHNYVDPAANVVVIYFEGRPVGCGCFRVVDSQVAEIKRMYTKPSMRGQGIARLVLQELEQWAIHEKFFFLILETGVKQQEALTVYSKSGYLRTENYGPYTNNPLSICMKKVLV
jgi:GNAT superfamily N-acetyltransferase